MEKKKYQRISKSLNQNMFIPTQEKKKRQKQFLHACRKRLLYAFTNRA